MIRLFIFLLLSLGMNSMALSMSPTGKRIVVVGEGVTGTWAAAKIAEHLTSKDELIIISPPKKEIVKSMGENVFLNYTTSSFIPIGIQIDTGVVNLEPPNENDLKNSHTLLPTSKIYVSTHLDQDTQHKYNRYLHGNKNKRFGPILLRYHREVCLTEWRKYIKKGGKGAAIEGIYPLLSDADLLEKIKEKIIKNRIEAGYLGEQDKLKIITPNQLNAILPMYSALIQTENLYALSGLNYDGQVKNKMVMDFLHNKISHAKPKVIKMAAWVSSLQTKKDLKGKTIVTGVNLKNKKSLQADVIVLAAGQGIEKILSRSDVHLELPILKKWGIVYSLSKTPSARLKENPTLLVKGLGITRDMPDLPMTFAVGEWILAQQEAPSAKEVISFVKQSILIWNKEFDVKKWEKNHLPIYVQPRPMTLDGFPVLDSNTKGLIIVNPSGSQGNTQAPGSAYFAASKVLEQLGRPVPASLKLTAKVEWKQFELYPGRWD